MNLKDTMIVRDSAGNLYRVLKAENPDIPQAFLGYPIKRSRKTPSGWMQKGQARLIRKLGCTVVEG